jgi:choline dehydrogenase-like flavoprotein
MDFDYIVVGAGSSGCVLANRLSADANVTVCLVEAGRTDRSFLIHLPIGVAWLFHHKTLNWRFETTPQKHGNGRQIYIPRGKVLGGSSAINGMIYTRGHPTDYDDWAALGNPGWSFREVLPYFRRSENNVEFGDSPYHGKGGELNVQFLDMYNSLVEVMFEAASRMQYRLIDDFCGPDHEGFARRQVTMKDGRRVSTATAFLDPVRSRPNLAILTETLTRKVIVEDGRATGIEVERAGKVERLKARREVVLSAGVIGSPQILMLSGIGNAEKLKAKGIAPIHHLPGVGENFREHVSAAVQYSSPTTVPWGLSWRSAPWMAWQALRYIFERKGFFANNMLHAGGFIKTDPGLKRPDVQLILMPVHRDATGRMGRGHGYALIAIVLRPESRGTLELASADPRDAPLIDPHFLEHPYDTETLVKGIRIARTMLESEPFAPYRGKELNPGRHIETDEQLRRFARENFVTVFHPVGTCRMGPGPDAVVDRQLKVHGLDGLRVVDCSIMPTLIGGNTNAPAIMVAEKAADMILGRLAPAAAALM